MPRQDPRVDAYIANSPDFSQPLLQRIRAAFLAADKDIEETIKWGVPYYVKNGLVGGMAAFKAHVDIGLRHAKSLSDPEKRLGKGSSLAGIQVRKPGDLPARRVLVAYIREVIALNANGTPTKRKPVKVPALPDDLAKALAESPKAMKHFDAFPPSGKRDYIEWIVEAKRATTRAGRIAQAVEWIADGKPRNWKYMK